MNKCSYCGRESDALHRDHVVPRSRGGPDNATNIVLACMECNSSKRDLTATEWLGNECPERIRDIERRINSKLERSFAKRDYKPKRKNGDCLCFFHIHEDGTVGYVGEVIEERGDMLRVEVCDAFSLVAIGSWELSGQIEDLKRSECRLYNDRTACASAAARINNRILDRRK